MFFSFRVLLVFLLVSGVGAIPRRTQKGLAQVTPGDGPPVAAPDGWWRVVTPLKPKTPLLLSCAVIRQRACGHPLGGKTIGVGQ